MQAVLGVGRIQHRLARVYGIGPTRSASGVPKRRAGAKDLFAFLERTVVPKQQRDDRHPLRSRQQCGKRFRLVGQRRTEVPVEPKYRLGLVQRVQHEASEHLCHRVEAILEGRHDAEISSAATQRPEQVRVVGGAGLVERTVRSDDVGRDQVVDR